jgi:DNA-binding transcriptional LysR family regulator
MFNLYQVKVFQAVASAGGISRAAERLYLSQPAVSQHIRSLEKTLDVKLFERGRRGVSLTPAGQVFLERTQHLLRMVHDATEATQAAARGEDFQRMRLRIGATAGVGACLLPHWIRRFYDQYPHSTVNLHIADTPELVHQLAGQALELAIVGDDFADESVEVTPLWDEEAAIVTAPQHPWAAHAFIHAAELAGQPFVSREVGGLAHAWERHTLSHYGIQPRVIAEFNSPVAIKQAVIAGLGVAMLPCFTVRNEVLSGQLHIVRLYEGTIVRALKLLWTENSLEAPGIDAFLRYLSAEFPSLGVRRIGDERSDPLWRILKDDATA